MVGTEFQIYSVLRTLAGHVFPVSKADVVRRARHTQMSILEISWNDEWFC